MILPEYIISQRNRAVISTRSTFASFQPVHTCLLIQYDPDELNIDHRFADSFVTGFFRTYRSCFPMAGVYHCIIG
jgi:hypothetical protein